MKEPLCNNNKITKALMANNLAHHFSILEGNWKMQC